MGHAPLTTAERTAAYKSRQKALANLARYDADKGTEREYNWVLVEEVPFYFALSAKQRLDAFRERQKAVCVTSDDVRNMFPRQDYKQTVRGEFVGPPDLRKARFDEVICDWLSISHPLREYYPPVNDGQILKIQKNGDTEWTTECWETLKCASSDTSLRIKCDGYKIMMTGNVGRFGQTDNLNGYTVSQCIEKWRGILAEYFGGRAVKKVNATTGQISIERFPAVDMTHFFGDDIEMVNRATGEIETLGTRITRCDLAGNFFTDNFAALTAMLMTRKLGQRPPKPGKFGPMWGYDSKRANWLKAKVYDKTCELEGRRTPATGATTARFEVQLGSEILKRRELHIEKNWKGLEMENVIFAEFSNEIFKEQATSNNWNDIPSRIRHYAIAWRDGEPLRSQCSSDATFYRVRKQLLEYGLDVSQPCNVMTLVRRIEVVRVMPLPARRAA